MGYRPWGHKELDTTERLTLSLFQECGAVTSWLAAVWIQTSVPTL